MRPHEPATGSPPLTRLVAPRRGHRDRRWCGARGGTPPSSRGRTTNVAGVGGTPPTPARATPARPERGSALGTRLASPGRSVATDAGRSARTGRLRTRADAGLDRGQMGSCRPAPIGRAARARRRRPRAPVVEVGLGFGRMDAAARARDLRRMKALATGLLLVATVIFLLARWWEVNDGPVWVGYVRATAEAGMVGALADWFAVTALFRRPLGLPIPHTAIIPTKKDVLGDSLGDFVGENFLSEDVVRDKLARVEVSSRVGALARPAGERRPGHRRAGHRRPRRRHRAARRGRAGGDRAGPGAQADGAPDRAAAGHGAAGRARRRRAPPAGRPGLRPRLRLGQRQPRDGAAGRARPGADLVAAVRRRPDRRPGLPRGAELRVGGEDRPGAPAAQGGRHVPRRVRRRPAERPGDHRAGRADQAPDRRATRTCSGSSARRGARSRG